MFGGHISKNAHGSIVNTIKVAYTMGANALQFNYSPPTSSMPGKPFTSSEIAEVNRLRKELGVYLVVHGKYLYNFCRDAAWQQKSLEDELKALNSINCDIVLHQGKNVEELKYDRATAIKSYVRNISSVLENTTSCTNGVLLENSCQQGTECGYTVDELAEIYNLFDPKYRPRVGFCIDLCHIFVAGSLDLRTADAVDIFFADFDIKIGLDKLKLIHFNDSNVCFDGHNDNHQDILVGYIGNPLLGGSSDGFKQVVKIASGRGIHMVLETPGPVTFADSVKLMRSWADNTDYEVSYIEKYKKLIAQTAEELQAKKKKILPSAGCVHCAPAPAPAPSSLVVPKAAAIKIDIKPKPKPTIHIKKI